MFYDYLCKGKSLYLSTQCLLITISFPDMDIVDKLNKEFLTQPFCKNEQLPEELNEYKRIATRLSISWKAFLLSFICR